ncbi:MAG: hypothetical protein H0V53_13830 [Rubrobacter sp.]|nr:hypothetical protein [Rubrobacter sp.]
MILAALATAGVHLYLFIIEGFLGDQSMLPIYQLLFVGNLVAYVVLAALLYWPAGLLKRFRPVTRTLLIAVSVAAIISYYHVGVFDLLGNVTKVVEVLLIALLTVDAGLSKSAGSGRSRRPRVL